MADVYEIKRELSRADRGQEEHQIDKEKRKYEKHLIRERNTQDAESD